VVGVRLQLLADSEEVGCLDITGGAPELNEQFRSTEPCYFDTLLWYMSPR
jgi:hypothetical protein